MFQDVTLGSARFKAKRGKQTADACAQTTPIATGEAEVQTEVPFSDGGTQTEPQVAGKGGKKDSTESEEQQQPVLAFLQRVSGVMLREMATNAQTSCCYGGLERYLDESEEKTVAKLFRLQFDCDAYFQPSGASTTAADASSLRLSCTGVSWNATGSVIAAAYGRFDHSGWCNYRSALCLWSVFQ
ncbi:hypothetical protein BBJ28_00020882, partial [Nothophytophthora sp. Chile5]